MAPVLLIPSEVVGKKGVRDVDLEIFPCAAAERHDPDVSVTIKQYYLDDGAINSTAGPVRGEKAKAERRIY